MEDPYHAFCEDSGARVEGALAGPLAGLTFAAKDLFDIAGQVTGGGNPDWLASHRPAADTAWVVDTLVNAGATMIGKTHTDEVSRGGFGVNRHYGTPINPAAPDRVPGGSSSGSAVAVAGRLVDFALGTDTGGSVRIPASFCGLYGIRPTHGQVALAGVMPQAPSFDTAGWFARDAELLSRIGTVLLGERIERARPGRVLIAEDAFSVADPGVRAALEPVVDRLTKLVAQTEKGPLATTSLSQWGAHQAVLQRAEAWETFRDWIEEVNPRFGFDVASMFAAGAATDPAALKAARLAKPGIVAAIELALVDDTFICIPTVPCIAPRRNAPRSLRMQILNEILSLTCIAGLAGTPQISLPLGQANGAPVGLSLIGARGSDGTLMGFAQTIAENLPLPSR